MKLSIIIPSFKRADLLDFGLQSLAKQDIPYSYEVIVLNDGIEDNTEEVCKKYEKRLNVKYIFTGQRNLNGDIKWRCPGFVFNIGVKEAKGEILILTCPEIFLLGDIGVIRMVEPILKNKKLLTIPDKARDDRDSVFLNKIKENVNFNRFSEQVKIYNTIKNPLVVTLPFFMGMSKDEFIAIGGYDEDFVGYCFDDTDFVARLIANGCTYHKIDLHVIHLYHSRHRYGLPEIMKKWKYNQKLWEEKEKNIQDHIVANKNKRIIPPEQGLVSIPSIEEKSYSYWVLKRIPKIAHFYWGNKTLPYLRYLTVFSFAKHNPDWEIRFYYPKSEHMQKVSPVPEHTYQFTGKDYYDELRKLPVKFIGVDFRLLNLSNELSEVHKSDFLRWHLLSIVGGLWSDMDIIYFKPMTSISINTSEHTELNTVVSLHHKYPHSVGFMLSSPDNGYYRYIYQKAKANFDSKEYESVGVLLLNPEFPTLESIKSRFPNLTVKSISPETVYAYDAHSASVPTIYQSSNMEKYTKDSIGLHWYAGHPLAKKYIIEVTYTNYSNYNNVLGKTIQRAYK